MVDLKQLSDIEILALTIIGEARGEPIEGQIAVGNIISNRLHGNPSRYKSYNDVCLEQKQFSCWNKSDSNYTVLVELAEKLIIGQKIEDLYLRQCFMVARAIVNREIMDNVHGAQNYLTKSLYYSLQKPHWAINARNITEKGNQVFFTV